MWRGTDGGGLGNVGLIADRQTEEAQRCLDEEGCVIMFAVKLLAYFLAVSRVGSSFLPLFGLDGMD